MTKLLAFISVLLLTGTAQANVNDCAGNLIEKMNYHAGRADKLCKSAQKSNADVMRFSNCVVAINQRTQMAPEIIAPYCMQRTDVAYSDCVVSTYNSDSNANAFKSCLKKSANFNRPATKQSLARKGNLPAPANVKITLL